jgi:hypothetical protein
MKKFTIILLTLVVYVMNGQESISTMGQDFSTSTGSLSLTLGQLSNETHDISSWSLQEGVHQVYKNSSSFEIIKLDSEYAFGIYPNPFQNYIVIQSETDKLVGSNYCIYDMSGRIILKGEIDSRYFRINTDFMPSASYAINITTADNIKYSLTIEKAQ